MSLKRQEILDRLADKSVNRVWFGNKATGEIIDAVEVRIGMLRKLHNWVELTEDQVRESIDPVTRFKRPESAQAPARDSEQAATGKGSKSKSAGGPPDSPPTA